MSDELLYIVSDRGSIDRGLALAYIADLCNRYPDRTEDADLLYGDRETLRAMDALGHVDIAFEDEQGRVYCGPPLLVPMPHGKSGRPNALFVGHRTPAVMAQLSTIKDDDDAFAAVYIDEHSRRYPFLPQRVRIDTDTADDMARMARMIGATLLEESAAPRIAAFSVTLDEYLGSQSRPMRTLPPGRCRVWNAGRLQFAWGKGVDVETELYEVEDGPTGLPHYWLRRGDRLDHVDREWGRYAVLRSQSTNVILRTPGKQVLVPSGALLPRLLARALTLCAGHAPLFVPKTSVPASSPEQCGFYCYRDVPDDVARVVAGKLGQELSPTTSSIHIEDGHA